MLVHKESEANFCRQLCTSCALNEPYYPDLGWNDEYGPSDQARMHRTLGHEAGTNYSPDLLMVGSE